MDDITVPAEYLAMIDLKTGTGELVTPDDEVIDIELPPDGGRIKMLVEDTTQLDEVIIIPHGVGRGLMMIVPTNKVMEIDLPTGGEGFFVIPEGATKGPIEMSVAMALGMQLWLDTRGKSTGAKS